jgi:polyhydroxyalkanoate synthase
LDFLAISQTFLDLNAAWMRDAESFSAYCKSLCVDLQAAGKSAAEQLQTSKPRTGRNNGEALIDLARDLWRTSQQYHQVLTRRFTEYVNRAPDLDADIRRRAQFWIRQILEMMTPSNFFWTNPRAVQHFVKSEGESLLKGINNWLSDLQHNDGMPQLADKAAFGVGRNLAITPGQVVYRNQLLEVIQYAPRTPRCRRVPIVLIQPWINKYYIFDLSPQNSFVRYLVDQGFTVFITSWKNPTGDMSHITFEDYMLHGALQAINVARDICRSPQVHAAGYCIGGTLLVALMGWLAHEGDDQPIADATLFAALADFAEPGDLKAFVNPTVFKTVERLVAADGVLKSQYLSFTFRLLNSSDLIWRSVTNNYFYGETPPRSDMLFWNSDGTNLPGAMCIFYLRSFYQENRMVRPNGLILDHRPIDLKQVGMPIYAVGAQKDHICPWPSTFQTCRLTSGPVRYVLANEGHITGIVNPPSPWNKKQFWAGSASRRRDAAKWLQKQKPATGSWWPDWLAWLQPRSGPEISPPTMGSDQYPPLGPAPGTYVLE